MEWTKADDAALFGAGAENALRDVGAVRALGLWDASHAMRWPTGDGMHAWLWVTRAGTLSTLCVCDDGGGFEGRDYVPIAELMAASWPKGWMTKRRKATVVQDACEVGGFVCGTLGREALICKAAEVGGDGLPMSVIVREGLPAIDVSELGERKWFGFTKWPAGAAELWARQWTKGDYRNMCRWAGVFEKSAKKRAERREQKAKRAKSSK